MPPFKRATRGGGKFASRGRGHVSRGRGGSRGLHTNSRGHKSAFLSTRVEATVEETGDRSSEGSAEDVGGNDTELEVSSDDEASASTSVISPYNVLLESLKANVLREQPVSKRQKVFHDSTNKKSKGTVQVRTNGGSLQLLEDSDLVADVEEDNHLSSEEAPDSEDEADDQDRKTIRVAVYSELT